MALNIQVKISNNIPSSLVCAIVFMADRTFRPLDVIWLKCLFLRLSSNPIINVDW